MVQLIYNSDLRQLMTIYLIRLISLCGELKLNSVIKPPTGQERKKTSKNKSTKQNKKPKKRSKMHKMRNKLQTVKIPYSVNRHNRQQQEEKSVTCGLIRVEII